MTVSLLYVLAVYMVFAALSALLFLFNVYHIARFGMQSPKTTAVIVCYTVAFLMVLTGSLIALSEFNWRNQLQFESPFEINVVTDGNRL